MLCPFHRLPAVAVVVCTDLIVNMANMVMMKLDFDSTNKSKYPVNNSLIHCTKASCLKCSLLFDVYLKTFRTKLFMFLSLCNQSVFHYVQQKFKAVNNYENCIFFILVLTHIHAKKVNKNSKLTALSISI